ncbi:head-tail adaptor protein [Rhodopseudomonas telluris]|uniref:Head-tail adaptor protein n=1 Tax=Rhodopseudomonas telluris TaxID=644215 RepID=A0ABV6EZK5_9BRAD
MVASSSGLVPTHTASELRHRVAFDRRVTADDGMGNVEAGWEQQFVVAAKVKARFGGEAVTAARLAGRQPVTLVVRHSAQAQQIGPDWQARDVRSGAVYAIRSIVDPDDGRQWIEILCETGAAVVP